MRKDYFVTFAPQNSDPGISITVRVFDAKDDEHACQIATHHRKGTVPVGWVVIAVCRAL